VTAQSVRTVTCLAPKVGAQHVLATVRSEVGPAVVDGLRMAAESLAELGVAMSVEFMPTSPLPSLEAAVDLLDAACPTPLLVLSAGRDSRFHHGLDRRRRWLLRHSTSPLALVPPAQRSAG